MAVWWFAAVLLPTLLFVFFPLSSSLYSCTINGPVFGKKNKRFDCAERYKN